MISLNRYPKEVLLFKITCLAWLAGKLITWKVWTSDRLLPVIPVFDFLPEFSNSFHVALFALSLAGLLALFVFPQKKYLFFIFFFVEISSCLLDQLRWQPWEYQYMLLFLFFLFYKKNTPQFLQLLAFMLAMTYIFSGLHKFNGGFLLNIWESMILRKFLHVDTALISSIYLHYFGLILALIEFLIGIGLLFLRKKKYAAQLAIFMHVLLLLILGPTGINYNPSVWPWNIALILYNVILFWNEKKIKIDYSFFKERLNVGVLFLTAFLPFLGLFGYWDGFLSFKVYPGNSKLLILQVKNLQKYPELLAYKVNGNYIKSNTAAEINLGTIAMRDLNVAIYSEERVYVKIKREWQQKFPHQENEFYICQYPYKTDNIKKLP